MTSLEWITKEINTQIKSIKKQISGLPKDVQKQIIQECVDILTEEGTT